MKITLGKAHTHAGVDYEAGASLDVSGDDASWIVANVEGSTTGQRAPTIVREFSTDDRL